MMLPEQSLESVKYEFKLQELADIAVELARTNIQITSWESEKTLTSAHLATLIKEARAKANDLATRYRNGFEMREVECNVVYDVQSGTKTYTDAVTGEFVRNAPMTREELAQMQLDFNGNGEN